MTKIQCHLPGGSAIDSMFPGASKYTVDKEAANAERAGHKVERIDDTTFTVEKMHDREPGWDFLVLYWKQAFEVTDL